jgi:hypothetical protein
MTQPKILALEAELLIKPSASLVRNFIRLFFYQTKFKPISKRQFETLEVMRILNIRHVISCVPFHKEFVPS